MRDKNVPAYVGAGAILLAIANPDVRRALVDAFRTRGAVTIIETSNYEGLVEILKNNVVDVLVADDFLSELPVAGVIRKVRQGGMHAHPFPLVAVLAYERQADHLHSLIDSGPDAVLLTPVSVTELYAKIDSLIAGRKAFVVTRDYIGPDRRKAPRDGGAQPQSVEVPNPLTQGEDPAIFLAAIEKASASLDSAKIQCSIEQLAWAMKSGTEADFAALLPLVEQLASTAKRDSLKAAARELAAALKGGDVSVIMASATRLTQLEAVVPVAPE